MLGGILDRVDSYIFTGALVFSFVKTILPLYGVWDQILKYSLLETVKLVTNRVGVVTSGKVQGGI